MSFQTPAVKRFNERGKNPQAASKFSVKQNLNVKDEKSEKVVGLLGPRNTTNVKSAASPRSMDNKSTGKPSSIGSRPLSARKPMVKSNQSTGIASPRSPKVSSIAQKQKYNKMKKELIDKQGEMFRVYDAMVKLREEMVIAGVKGVEIPEELKIVNASAVGDGEDLSAAHNRIAQVTENKLEYLTTLEKKLNSVSFWSFDLCEKVVAINNSVLTELSHMGHDKLKPSDSEMNKTIEGLKKESHSLMQSLEKKRQSHHDTVTEVLQEMKALLQDRESQKHNQKSIFQEELTKIQHEKNALAEKLKTEIFKGKGKQAETENSLNSARQQIKDVESKVTSQESRIQSFHSQMRKFESQIRARERTQTIRLNDAAESTRMLKEAKQTLEKQKEGLEQRVEDLRRIMNQKERKQEEAINKLNSKITELNDLLSTEEDEKQRLETELGLVISEKNEMESLKNEIETQKNEMETQKNEMETQKNEIEKKLLEMNDALNTAKKMAAERAKDSKQTPHEEELWTQLQGTQVLLESTQQTLATVQQEKEKIEASLKKLMIQTEGSKMNKDDELVDKEHIIIELKENIKSISSESDKKSRTISELKRKLHELEKQLAIKHYFTDKSKGVDAQQKVPGKETDFLRLQQQNTEMEKHIRELHSELQHKENEQSKSLKGRDELIKVLKNKEKKQAEQIMDLWSLVQEHESAASTVCKDMSGKDAEIKDLQKILEIKQLQILRLEKLVRKQEEQLDRWGLQRTRQESRIAELENTLREKQRYSEDSSGSRQEKSEKSLVEKHTCGDYVNPLGKQENYSYLDEKMNGVEMMSRKQLQKAAPEDKTITSSYIESDCSHSQMTPNSAHNQSYIESDWSHSHTTSHSFQKQMSKNSVDMILETCNSINTDQIAITNSPKTPQTMKHACKNTVPPIPSLFNRKSHLADQENVTECYRSENAFPNCFLEYSDVLVPEQCTMIYKNVNGTWQYQDTTSEEGQSQCVYDDDSDTKLHLPTLQHNMALPRSHHFSHIMHKVDTNTKRVSKSDPTSLNKALPCYYNCKGEQLPIGDNIRNNNNNCFLRSDIGLCRVCGSQFASDVITVQHNYSEPNREILPACHGEPNVNENNAVLHKLSPHVYQSAKQGKHKTFPVAEVFEIGEVSTYLPHSCGDQISNTEQYRRRKYSNCGRNICKKMRQGHMTGINNLPNSSVIMCASPSAVLLLNCPYITNYLLHTSQFLQNSSLKHETDVFFKSTGN